jgi:HK97 family phage major capsid protein
MSRFDLNNVPTVFSKSLLYAADTLNALDAADYALKGGDYQSARLLKAAVAPITSTSAPALAETQLASDDFVSKVRPRTLMGRMPLVRRTPYLTELARNVGEAQVSWIGETGWTPAGKLNLDRTGSLRPRKVGVLVVIPQEVIRIGGHIAQVMIDQELMGATIAARDTAFIDPDNAGIANTKPASILYGISPRTSSGDPTTDIAALIDAYTGNLDSAIFVASNKLAARLHLFRDSGGSSPFVYCGVGGGEIAQIPVIASDAVPDSTSGSILALVDQSGVMVAAEESAELRFSTQAAIQMTDNASGASTLVSMYQADSVAVQCICTTDWALARPDAAVWMTTSY